MFVDMDIYIFSKSDDERTEKNKYWKMTRIEHCQNTRNLCLMCIYIYEVDKYIYVYIYVI